jgi:hypothetical protein
MIIGPPPKFHEVRGILLSWRGDVPLLTQPTVEAILAAVRHGERPAAARQLLADAEFHGFHAQDRNHGIALVLAAVACEMTVKTHLRESCAADQAKLVDLVLENPRDVSLAAASLFDKGLAGVSWLFDQSRPG